jgi:hypothetical protein
MAIYDIVSGGGQTIYFTDWMEARNFVIFTAIVNSNSLTDEEKVMLQDLEQDAYQEKYGQLLLSEREEIAEYYNYIYNNARSITQNDDFLNLAAELAGASRETAAPDEDLELDEAATEISKTLGFVALVGLGLYVFTR